jgi:threonine/homoserine/homoserine lactone efflux protein
MLDPALLAAWLLACLVLIVTPGPDMAFVLAQTVAGGARRGWAACCGIFAGAACHIVAAAFGVAALVTASPALFDALRIAGALYLLWLGAKALRGAIAPGATGAAPALAADLGAAFRQGLVTNLLNPKVLLFFLAILPQFVDPARSAPWLQMLLLGPLLPLLAVPFYWLLIQGAGRLAERLRGRAGRWLDAVAGTLFVALGLRLLLAR